MDEAWARLETWQHNHEVGMSKETYFNLCQQMQDEPNPDKIPPDVEDFPADMQKAIIIFNKLGDRIYQGVGYLGKDYTQLPTYIDIYEVENKQLFMETLLRLDSKIIEKSASDIKAQNDKIRQKSK